MDQNGTLTNHQTTKRDSSAAGITHRLNKEGRIGPTQPNLQVVSHGLGSMKTRPEKKSQAAKHRIRATMHHIFILYHNAAPAALHNVGLSGWSEATAGLPLHLRPHQDETNDWLTPLDHFGDAPGNPGLAQQLFGEEVPMNGWEQGVVEWVVVTLPDAMVMNPLNPAINIQPAEEPLQQLPGIDGVHHPLAHDHEMVVRLSYNQQAANHPQERTVDVRLSRQWYVGGGVEQAAPRLVIQSEAFNVIGEVQPWLGMHIIIGGPHEFGDDDIAYGYLVQLVG